MITADIAAAGWDQIAATVSGAQDQLSSLRQAFVDAVVSGDDFRTLTRKAKAVLSPAEWHWPWFNEWEARFAAAGLSPFLWPGNADEDEVDEEQVLRWRREDLAALIIQTAASRAYTLAHLANYRPGYVVALSSLDDADRLGAADHIARVAAGDFTQIPPFFPGDRSTISIRPGRFGNAI